MTTSDIENETAIQPIRSINFSATKRAPLTPLRAFRPTPLRARESALKVSESPSPTKGSKALQQEPLFLDGPDTPLGPYQGSFSLVDTLADLNPLEEDESDDELPIRRVTARAPRRVAISDSESDTSPGAGPSKEVARQIIDYTGSDSDDDDNPAESNEAEDMEKTQAWMDKYYDDSLGSLRDFIVDDSDDSDATTDSDHSEESHRPSKKAIKPRKHPSSELQLPDLTRLLIVDSSDEEPESISQPSVPPTPGRKSKKSWEAERVKIAEEVFADLDKRVFDSKLGPSGAGAKIDWSSRLLTTAGTAQKQRKTEADGTTKQDLKIVLSMKVCTGEEQILSTVAHEMCHLATWVISNEMKNPHGRIFKSWGQKVMKKRKDIETKHTYEIEYKFQWKCSKVACAKIYQRHSKSIDVEKDRCSRCRGALEPMFETKKETAFQAYLKQNMTYAKQSLPGASHGEVMRALAQRWKTAGPEANHLDFWIAEVAR